MPKTVSLARALLVVLATSGAIAPAWAQTAGGLDRLAWLIGFENPGHDFPQRVIYKRQGETRLLASIEGTRKGVARTIEFPMHRTSCDQ